jgi:predicted ester cyclase
VRHTTPLPKRWGALAVSTRKRSPDLRLEIEHLPTDGPAAADEGIITGTHDGVFHTPHGDVAPRGRAIALRWAAVYVTDGDTLKSEDLFFDQMDFLGQLGLLPG